MSNSTAAGAKIWLEVDDEDAWTLATVESTALAGKPIVVLVDSGGAATALHKYCTLGLEAVEAKFQNQSKRLQAIKNLNDTYGGKQLLFFSLEESSGAANDLDGGEGLC